MHFEVLIVIVLVWCSAPAAAAPAAPRAGGVAPAKAPHQRSLWKRFVDPSSSYGDFNHDVIGKIRMRRSSEEECERLELCRLHAHSASSFLAAFQLYFVNKENARLWDHRARSPADCARRYSCDR